MAAMLADGFTTGLEVFGYVALTAGAIGTTVLIYKFGVFPALRSVREQRKNRRPS